jgi:ribosomal protein S18 acetylase RimI-like enzyme
VLTEVEPDDVRDLLSIRHSNPDRLARTEGSSGDPSAYDAAMLERDLAVMDADPSRHVLVARLHSNPRVVGYVDVLDEHPEDGLPWIGVVEVHAGEQRRGLGRQCAEGVLERARKGLAACSIRAAVDADDSGAAAFLTSLGFVSVDARGRSSPQGRVPVIVYERALVSE